MTNVEKIRSAVSSIRNSVDSMDCPATEEECTDIRCELDDIEYALDDLEPLEECDDTETIPEGWEEVIELLPSKPSVGDMLALKEIVINWKRDTYGDF